MSPIQNPLSFTVTSCDRTDETGWWVKKKEIKISVSGVYRTKYIAWAEVNGVAASRIYKNGASYGTYRNLLVSKVLFVEDLHFLKDDLCQIYVASNGGVVASVESFQVSYPVNFAFDVQQEV